MINYEGMELSLKGRNILVTGVSRPMGIGATLAKVLAQAGANVITHGYWKYDSFIKFADASEDYAKQLQNQLSSDGCSIVTLPSSDLSQKETPQEVIKMAAKQYGYIDGLVLDHTYSTWCPIGEWTAEDIDMHMNTNVRAQMLMIQEFSKQLPEGKRGAVTMFTSGQERGAMTKEIPYAVSKAAIVCICKQTAAALAKQNIQVNCINPGPVDTGYLFGEEHKAVADMFPSGRWGTPMDTAKLVHFLQSDYSNWITGEVISSEGGFSR